MFFKFLALKPDLEQDIINSGKQPKRLRLLVPDTIVINDNDNTYWVYTDTEGNVRRSTFHDSDLIEKFKSQSNDEKEIIAVYKQPVVRNGRVEENNIEVLNLEGLERSLFSKSLNQCCVQRFIKCRGPKAFICRSIWCRNKPPYVYIITNKRSYQDPKENDISKFITNSQRKDSYVPFYSSSGKHLQDTNKFMNNIVKFIEGHSGLIFDELIGDFIK